MHSIHIIADTLPEAWERAVIDCWRAGESFPTEYDKPNDPYSRDVCALIHVKSPMKEPRIHRAFPGGLDDLEKYRAEVLYGVHDHWIDPAAGKWEYTYHERLFKYTVPGLYGYCDQIQAVIMKLKQAPHTRRAQAVTWQAWNDISCDDPTCLQRLWFRVQDGKLNMNIHIRSNDAYKAGFMNMYAFIELQKYVADTLGMSVGEYIHIADSFHIYGSYFEEFEGFLKTIDGRPFIDRVWDTKFAVPHFIDGCNTLLSEDDIPEIKKDIIRNRKKELEFYGAQNSQAKTT